MSRYETPQVFFEACETGAGWDGYQSWCSESATFSCQADALADTKTLSACAEWTNGLLTPVPDGHYVLTAFVKGVVRDTVVASAEFHGTQTGTGGPVAPTGKAVVSDYAYVMHFEGDKISHMTKIWNDMHALRGLVWTAHDMGWRSLLVNAIQGNQAMLRIYECLRFRFIDRYPECSDPIEVDPYFVYMQYDLP